MLSLNTTTCNKRENKKIKLKSKQDLNFINHVIIMIIVVRLGANVSHALNGASVLPIVLIQEKAVIVKMIVHP